MMGDAQEMPQRVSPEKRPCVDGQTQRHSPTSTGDAVSKVLDDDNLLREIIVRVGFPTTLVRAALVCKRWLCHISDPKFLSRFCKLNPPRLLGIYIDNNPIISQPETPHFVPMLPQHPELAVVVRHVASHDIDTHGVLGIMDCRNGSVFARCREGGVSAHGVYRPLCPKRGFCIIPPFPTAQDLFQQILGGILSKEEGDGLSYLYVLAESISGARTFRMRVYMLRDGVWCMHASATEQILHSLLAPKAVLVGNKIYMTVAFNNDIIVLDLTASSLSRIMLPQGVEYQYSNTTLSRADDASSVYLTHAHANDLQLQIWLHKGDNWLLVHTICLLGMWVNLRMLDHTLEDEHIDFPRICQVGDNVELVFLKMCGYALYLDVKSRTLHKMHRSAENDYYFSDIYPFMMIWPPTFPALKDDPEGMPCEGHQESFGWSATRKSSRKSRELHFLSSISNCFCYNSSKLVRMLRKWCR